MIVIGLDMVAHNNCQKYYYVLNNYILIIIIKLK
jgi:hypothetical protein